MISWNRLGVVLNDTVDMDCGIKRHNSSWLGSEWLMKPVVLCLRDVIDVGDCGLS